MLMVHEFGQRMVQRGGGAIVNVGSTVIVRGSPRAPQYAAGKYGGLGVRSPTPRRSLRQSGSTHSPEASWRPKRCWRAWSGRRAGATRCFPPPRQEKTPKPEDMTGAALFLASEDAHHSTRSSMIADGGYSMLGA